MLLVFIYTLILIDFNSVTGNMCHILHMATAVHWAGIQENESVLKDEPIGVQIQPNGNDWQIASQQEGPRFDPQIGCGTFLCLVCASGADRIFELGDYA